MVPIREKVLTESLNYHGYNFWENYTLSHIVKNISEEVSIYGKDKTLDMYSFLFGEETRELFEYIIHDEMLSEVSKIKGTLLFESEGISNVDNYITEVSAAYIAKGTGGGFVPSQVKKGLVGFLGGIWNKVKEFGAGVLDKIVPFIKSGATWAKNFLKKGIDAIASSPVAQIALPILAITGGAIAAKKIINKIRKKAGKKKLTPQEEQALQRISKKKQDKIEQMRSKVDKNKKK